MRVRILRPVRVQDAGVERVLTVGASYDFPTVVAQALLRSRDAEQDRACEVPEVKEAARRRGR